MEHTSKWIVRLDLGQLGCSTDSDPANAEFPITDFGFAPEQLITFQMDMKEFSNPSGSAKGGIKIEFYDTNGAGVGDMDMGGWRNWPERKVDITSEWATYRWQMLHRVLIS